MISKPLVFGLAIGLLSACSSETPQTTSNDAASALEPSCDLSLQSAVGQPITSVTVPDTPKYRVMRPNEPVSADFQSDRTSIALDENDIIVDVSCN